MTKEQIKEELSNKYVGILACNKGYKLNKPSDTGGVDYSVTYDISYEINGRKRFVQSGNYIDLQLKSTTERNIEITNDYIKYDLEVKTYNDLLKRRDQGNAPLILILFILPEYSDNWVSVEENELLLRKNAFWFYPDDSMNYSNNQRTNRVEIPLANKLNKSCFSSLFDRFYS